MVRLLCWVLLCCVTADESVSYEFHAFMFQVSLKLSSVSFSINWNRVVYGRM